MAPAAFANLHISRLTWFRSFTRSSLMAGDVTTVALLGHQQNVLLVSLQSVTLREVMQFEGRQLNFWECSLLPWIHGGPKLC